MDVLGVLFLTIFGTWFGGKCLFFSFFCFLRVFVAFVDLVLRTSEDFSMDIITK